MGITQKLIGAISNAFAEVKAGNTPPVIADTALVVGLRPDDPIITQFAPVDITGQGGQLALNNNIILAVAGAGSYDVDDNRSATFQIVPAAGTVTAGAITFEGSLDGANWVPVSLYDRAAPANAPISTYTLVASTPRFFVGDTLWKYFRARISTAITGTTTGVQCFSFFSRQDFTPAIYAMRLTDGVNVAPSGDAAARGMYVRPTDGTSAQTMKAASVAPLPADIGAVVSLSPNLPVTSMYSVLSLATTNAVSIKATAGKVYAVSVMNSSAATKYVRLYNLAVAPTVGTSTPYKVIAVPAGTSKEVEFGTLGLTFGTGISIAITNLSPDNDATAVAAGDVRVLIAYI